MRHAGIVVAALLAACAGPAPKEDFYVLSAPAVEVSGDTPVVLVQAVSLPEAVDRTALVIRTGANRVDIDDAHRWAEPLRSAIPRVLADNLKRELGTTRVFTTRHAGLAADYRVAVEVQRFDSSLDEGATLEAVWTVTPPTGSARSGHSLARAAAPSRDAAGIAAAHSRALEDLARDIAAAIRR